jgi:hypothetical protein
MSGFELDSLVAFWRSRQYLAEKYSLLKEANPPDHQQLKNPMRQRKSTSKRRRLPPKAKSTLKPSTKWSRSTALRSESEVTVKEEIEKRLDILEPKQITAKCVVCGCDFEPRIWTLSSETVPRMQK